MSAWFEVRRSFDLRGERRDVRVEVWLRWPDDGALKIGTGDTEKEATDQALHSLQSYIDAFKLDMIERTKEVKPDPTAEQMTP